MGLAALAASCSGGGNATDATAEVEAVPASPPTTAEVAPTTEAAPTSPPTQATAPTSAPDNSVVLGLSVDDYPPDLDPEAVELRAVLLLILDTSVSLDDKMAYLEGGELLRDPLASFMAVLDGLAGQFLITEPEIEITGNTGVISFEAQGPAIGVIGYNLDADLVDGRWVMTTQSMCVAVAISNVLCG